jgi:hypothetical protein
MKLMKTLPPFSKVFVSITPGSHEDEENGIACFFTWCPSLHFFSHVAVRS